MASEVLLFPTHNDVRKTSFHCSRGIGNRDGPGDVRINPTSKWMVRAGAGKCSRSRIRIAVQVQDAGAILSPAIASPWRIQRLEIQPDIERSMLAAASSRFRPRSESVILSIEGSAASGAVFPVYRQFTVPSSTRHLRLAYESRTPSARPYRSRKRPKPGLQPPNPSRLGIRLAPPGQDFPPQLERIFKRTRNNSASLLRI